MTKAHDVNLGGQCNAHAFTDLLVGLNRVVASKTRDLYLANSILAERGITQTARTLMPMVCGEKKEVFFAT